MANLNLEPDKGVMIEVVASACSLMKEGDRVYLRGPVIDYERSAPLCLSAVVGIYPWIMAARFGIASHSLGHDNGYRLSCPDRLVELHVSTCADDGTLPSPLDTPSGEELN